MVTKCSAGHRVRSRFGQDLSLQESDEQFYPGVQFFFDTRGMFQHPRAEWDGVHPVKIREFLELDPYLKAVVVSSTHLNGSPLTLKAQEHLQARIIYLDNRQHFGLTAWSNAAIRAAF